MKLLLLSILFLNLTAFTCSNNSNGKVNGDAKDTTSGKEQSEQKVEKSKITGVYMGKTDEMGILIEDNRTWNSDPEFTSGDSEGYTKYIDYVRTTGRKYSSEKEPIEIVIDGFKPEFKRITDLTEGEKLYIATKDNVLEGSVSRYFINMDDEIGSGNMFYAIADIPNALLLQTDEPVIVTRDKINNPINAKNITDANIITNAKKILEPMVKDIKMSEDDSGNQTGDKNVTIDNEDLMILDKGNGEYVVGFTKRISFDSFTGMIFTMDSNGKMVNKVSRFTPGDFGYSKLLGIIDLNNDGELEYLVESGYYEGSGYILYNSNDGQLTEVASGFFFGV